MITKKNPYSFGELYSISFSRDPLIDTKKPECYLSIIASFITTVVLYFLYQNNDISSLTSTLQSITLNVAIGLISLIGLIIGGLAIIAGTVSNKIANAINKDGKSNDLLSILFSFYYIGAVLAVLIILYLLAYLVVSINAPLSLSFYFLIGSTLSYGLCFCIFYSVSLLGTCINIFIITCKYTADKQQLSPDKDLESYFESIKTNTITYLLVHKGIVSQDEFLDALNTRISHECPIQLQESMHKHLREYYSLDGE